MRTTCALLACLALTALAAASAAAAETRYIARTFAQPASGGLAVTGSLSRFRAVPRARVILPVDWRRLRARAGRLRFLTPGRGCRYRVTFTVRSRLAAPQDAEADVVARLPESEPRRILEDGRRGGSAFRVTRPPSSGGDVHLRGLRAAVLTRRTDVAPAGQVAWSELAVSADSRAGDECHAGTWREVLGPQLGDALASARSGLRFVPRGQ